MGGKCSKCSWLDKISETCRNESSDSYGKQPLAQIECELFTAKALCSQCANSAYNAMDRAYFCFNHRSPNDGRNVTNIKSQPCFEKKIRCKAVSKQQGGYDV